MPGVQGTGVQGDTTTPVEGGGVQGGSVQGPPDGGGGGDNGDEFWDYVKLLMHFQGDDGQDTTTDEIGNTVVLSTGGHLTDDVAGPFGGTCFTSDSGFNAWAAVTDVVGLAITDQDFCLELWHYHATAGVATANPCIYASATNRPIILECRRAANFQYAASYVASVDVVFLDGALAPLVDQWVHWAYVRDGDQFSFYRNGILVNTVSYAPALVTGVANPQIIFPPGNLNYLGDTRLTIGVPRYTGAFTPPTEPFPDDSPDPDPPDPDVDPNFANVQVLLHFNGADGTNSFTDQIGHTVSVVNDAVHDDTAPKFGAGALVIPDAVSYIQIGPDADLYLGAPGTAYTIEGWVKFDSLAFPDAYGTLFYYSDEDDVVGGFLAYMYDDGTLDIQTPGGSNLQSLDPLVEGVWTHIAIVRETSNMLTLYVDGVEADNFTNANANIAVPYFRIGCGDDDVGYPGCAMSRADDWRITPGVARYTFNFTPPALPFPDA